MGNREKDGMREKEHQRFERLFVNYEWVRFKNGSGTGSTPSSESAMEVRGKG